LKGFSDRGCDDFMCNCLGVPVSLTCPLAGTMLAVVPAWGVSIDG